MGRVLVDEIADDPAPPAPPAEEEVPEEELPVEEFGVRNWARGSDGFWYWSSKGTGS